MKINHSPDTKALALISEMATNTLKQFFLDGGGPIIALIRSDTPDRDLRRFSNALDQYIPLVQELVGAGARNIFTTIATAFCRTTQALHPVVDDWRALEKATDAELDKIVPGASARVRALLDAGQDPTTLSEWPAMEVILKTPTVHNTQDRIFARAKECFDALDHNINGLLASCEKHPPTTDTGEISGQFITALEAYEWKTIVCSLLLFVGLPGLAAGSGISIFDAAHSDGC